MCAALLLTTLACSAIVAAADGAAPQQITVRINGGQVTEPQARVLVVSQHTMLEIHWHSDASGELHVHGYDITVRLQKNTAVTSRFLAKASGRFPVTSHGVGDDSGHSHAYGALLYIEVHPD
jgi:hypothetical protein